MFFLPVLEKYLERYKFYLINGKQKASNSKVVFGALTRNSFIKIKKNLEVIDELGKYFKDYKIVIYENDSIDGTKEILKEIAYNNQNIKIIGSDYNRPQFGPVKSIERIKYLSQYRDELKNFICNNYNDYDYVIIFDLDFDQISIDGIFNSFGYLNIYNDIDCMAGNSYQISNNIIRNYDCWAFKLNDWEFNSNKIISSYQKYPDDYWFQFFIVPNGGEIYKVLSAFGGSAIYKMDFYKIGKYSKEPFDLCDHVLFHKDIWEKTDGNFKLYVNPSQITLM
jgi:hypothetical protein